MIPDDSSKIPGTTKVTTTSLVTDGLAKLKDVRPGRWKAYSLWSPAGDGFSACILIDNNVILPPGAELILYPPSSIDI